jgi:hypothetical protein
LQLTATVGLQWIILQINSSNNSRNNPLKRDDLYLYLQYIQSDNDNSLLPRSRNNKTVSSRSSRSNHNNEPNLDRNQCKNQPQCDGTQTTSAQ